MRALQAGLQRDEALSQLAQAQSSAEAMQQGQAGFEADLHAARAEASAAVAERDSLAQQAGLLRDEHTQVCTAPKGPSQWGLVRYPAAEASCQRR